MNIETNNPKNRHEKILISLSVIVAVGAVVAGATGAFFSDTETSTGNTFTAGAIDLGISNDSWLNGVHNAGTSWSQTFDLDDGSGPAEGGVYLYFDFDDLKPGDWGEDTIDFRVHNNDAWVCTTVTLDTSAENTITEPEGDLGDTGPVGELADEIDFIWWADDGDNVLETDEETLPSGPLGLLGIGGSATVTIADSVSSIFPSLELDLLTGAVNGEQTYYIGKAWCFGEITLDPVTAGDGVSPAVDPGFDCDGSGVGNISQSDSLTATISFSAIQERNNGSFVCSKSS